MFLSESISFFLFIEVNCNSSLIAITFSAGKKQTTILIYLKLR